MNEVALSSARFPLPANLAGDGIDARKWSVLCNATFPSARTPEAIVMALDYCRARGLDVFKRPVNIVPMWNSTLRKEVETIWPGINEVQTTAARTKQWAGMDEPSWGEDVTNTFEGRTKKDNGWEERKVQVTYPKWCGVTVYRMIDGQRCPFTEPVYWLEAYSRMGGSDLPTSMWIKRPRGQLHKVAKAASLRAAFPEEGEYTAEEMEGKEIEAGGVVIEHEAPIKPPKRTMAEISANKKRREDECAGVQKDLSQIETLSELARYEKEHLTPEFMASLGNAQFAVEEFLEQRRNELSELSEPSESVDDDGVITTGTVVEQEKAANNKADYIRNCHNIIDEADHPTPLIKWWNAENKHRIALGFSVGENGDLQDRVKERIEELRKTSGDVVIEAGG